MNKIKKFEKIFWENDGNTKKIAEKINISVRTAQRRCKEYKDYLKKIVYEKGISHTDSIPPQIEEKLKKLEEENTKLKNSVSKEKIKIYQKRIKSLEDILRKESAKTEIIVDTLESLIEPIDYYSPKYIPKENPNNIEETAVLLLSDLHGGRITPSFNPSILCKRIDILEKNMLKIINGILRKTYNINTLRIHFLGDIADHESLFPGQQFEVNYGVAKQIYSLLIPALTKFIANLTHHFKRIKIRCVPGNHGRNSKFSDKVTNWDLILYNSLKISLQNYKNIDWKIACFTEDNNKLFIMNDPPFFLYHGHGIKMYNRTPWYGVEDRFKSFGSIFPEAKIFNLGHFHTCFMTDINEKTIIANGTFLT